MIVKIAKIHRYSNEKTNKKKTKKKRVRIEREPNPENAQQMDEDVLQKTKI